MGHPVIRLLREIGVDQMEIDQQATAHAAGPTLALLTVAQVVTRNTQPFENQRMCVVLMVPMDSARTTAVRAVLRRQNQPRRDCATYFQPRLPD